MVALKRLILRKFGSTSNFVLVILLTASCYVLVRNLLSLKSTTYVPEEAVKKQQDIKREKTAPPTKPPSYPKATTIDQGCEIEEKCHENAIPYKLVSGDGLKQYPMMCLNGKLLVHKDLRDNKISRGINMVVINQHNLAVKSIETFDTWTDDTAFYRKLRSGTEDGDIILMASYDEMSNGIRDPSIKLMEQFGSQQFANVKFRDSFVMIGQRGVAKGKAIELAEPKGNKDFAKAAIISGCADFPLGVITPVKLPSLNFERAQTEIVTNKFVKNCGLREPCKQNEFAVHVFTGKDKTDEPMICVDGRYVIAKNTNDAGRGINIVVVGNGKEVIKVAHFDTYAEDSTNLEIFLEGLYDNVILIAVTFDEASTKLGTLARNLFFELGSSQVQNLKHRDAWYLIGRKGIKGFSPLEEISYAGAENAYPVPLDRRFCVPQTLKGMIIKPDPSSLINDKRRDFCSRFDGYGDFCTSENIDKPLLPAPIINKTLEEHPVYNTPIMVVGAMSHNALRMTLETLIMQPGIRTENVYVCVDEKLSELESLIELFGFQYVMIESSFSYMEIMHKALTKIFGPEFIDDDKMSVIVLEEELVLSPDFLYFFTQVYDIFMNDPDLVAISAFNPNSYHQVDGSASYVYRVNDFPGLGFMLKRSVYDTYLKGKLNTCCAQRAWYNWLIANDDPSKHFDVLIPDVSRVFRRPYDISSKDFRFLSNLFNRRRKTNLIPFPELVETEHFAKRDPYNKFLGELVKSAIEISPENCYSTGNITMPTTKNGNYKIVFEQNDDKDLSKLKKICECFHLFVDESQPPKGIYLNSILRFNSKENNFLFIGSKNALLNV